MPENRLPQEVEQELYKCIAEMSNISSIFYGMATRCGNHGFIEFCGLMNEYIKICRQSVEAGIDFRYANAHSGISLLSHDFNRLYFEEKLNCIMGSTYQVSLVKPGSPKGKKRRTGTG